jgi:replicative DNA helicase
MSRTFSLDTEHALLSCLITAPETYDRVADIITEGDFVNAGNRAIFEATRSLIMACKEVDAITVHQRLAEMGGSELTLADINAIAMVSGTWRAVRRYAEILRAASLERNLAASLEQAAEIVAEEGEYQGRLEQITALFSGLSHKSARKMPKPISDLLAGRIDYYNAMAAGEVPSGWRTRIPTLDRLLSGGLRGGKVYVVAARPKVGKTSLCAQIAAVFAKEQMPTLILSQEMPEEEIVDRAVANTGRVSYSSLLTGKFDDEDWNRLAEGIDQLTRLPLHIDDQGGLTLGDIRTKARSVKGLKLLVIDYLQLCYGSGGRQSNRNEEIGEISRGIKTLAKELGCAVLLLSQLNRDVESRPDKEPRLSDLRESGSIEQDADAVIFLWPVKDYSDFGHKLVACGVAANRSGSTGKFGMDFQGRYQLWNESSDELAPNIAPAARAKRHFEAD